MQPKQDMSETTTGKKSTPNSAVFQDAVFPFSKKQKEEFLELYKGMESEIPRHIQYANWYTLGGENTAAKEGGMRYIAGLTLKTLREKTLLAEPEAFDKKWKLQVRDHFLTNVEHDKQLADVKRGGETWLAHTQTNINEFISVDRDNNVKINERGITWEAFNKFRGMPPQENADNQKRQEFYDNLAQYNKDVQGQGVRLAQFMEKYNYEYENGSLADKMSRVNRAGESVSFLEKVLPLSAPNQLLPSKMPQFQFQADNDREDTQGKDKQSTASFNEPKVNKANDTQNTPAPGNTPKMSTVDNKADNNPVLDTQNDKYQAPKTPTPDNGADKVQSHAPTNQPRQRDNNQGGGNEPHYERRTRDGYDRPDNNRNRQNNEPTLDASAVAMIMMAQTLKKFADAIKKNLGSSQMLAQDLHDNIVPMQANFNHKNPPATPQTVPSTPTDKPDLATTTQAVTQSLAAADVNGQTRVNRLSADNQIILSNKMQAFDQGQVVPPQAQTQNADELTPTPVPQVTKSDKTALKSQSDNSKDQQAYLDAEIQARQDALSKQNNTVSRSDDVSLDSEPDTMVQDPKLHNAKKASIATAIEKSDLPKDDKSGLGDKLKEYGSAFLQLMQQVWQKNRGSDGPDMGM